MRRNGTISPDRLGSAACSSKRDGSVTMGEHVIKLPDVGEGVAEAELVEWHVKVGDLVREDTVLAAVMTDKATVEIPSPVEGEILWLGARVGETVAVGSPLSVSRWKARERRATSSRTRSRRARSRRLPPKPPPRNEASASPRKDAPRPRPSAPSRTSAAPSAPFGAPRREGEKPLAAPSVRQRARDAGVDLRQVSGEWTGRPHHASRISRLHRARAAGAAGARSAPQQSVEEHQGHRPAPSDRREDGACEVAHPAHHLHRGDRCHRARGTARCSQQRKARRPAKADPAALPDAGDGKGDRRATEHECTLR